MFGLGRESTNGTSHTMSEMDILTQGYKDRLSNILTTDVKEWAEEAQTFMVNNPNVLEVDETAMNSFAARASEISSQLSEVTVNRDIMAEHIEPTRTRLNELQAMLKEVMEPIRSIETVAQEIMKMKHRRDRIIAEEERRKEIERQQAEIRAREEEERQKREKAAQELREAQEEADRKQVEQSKIEADIAARKLEEAKAKEEKLIAAKPHVTRVETSNGTTSIYTKKKLIVNDPEKFLFEAVEHEGLIQTLLETGAIEINSFRVERILKDRKLTNFPGTFIEEREATMTRQV